MMRKRDPELEAKWGTVCIPVRMQMTVIWPIQGIKKCRYSSIIGEKVRIFVV